MAAAHIHCQSFSGDVLYEPWEILAESGQPFTSFQTYWARCVSTLDDPNCLLGPAKTRHAIEDSRALGDRGFM